MRDPRATFRQSLEVLRVAKESKPDLITKTSIMLGVGEEDADIVATLEGQFADSGWARFATLMICDTLRRVEEDRRRRRDVRAIHAAHKATHESSRLHPSGEVCALGQGRRVDGIPLRRIWSARAKFVQSESAAEECCWETAAQGIGTQGYRRGQGRDRRRGWTEEDARGIGRVDFFRLHFDFGIILAVLLLCEHAESCDMI